ncbi:MAG: DUF5011 domain-containing protein [Candidatus Zambryskibacteria bacterium]|nr:DUF5011 domain-containing protein [Candidatus Zambryskibacteria bacterium]
MSFLNHINHAKKLCGITVIILSLLFVSPQKGYAQYIDISQAAKEYGLDFAASTLAKNILRKLTAQTVNWINSGFQGNPAYVTDPGQFFLGVADTEASKLLSSGGLSNVCGPFRAQVRLALVKNYLAETDNRYYSCSLGQFERNYNSFINDFSQGGWDGWFNVTQNNRNNPYGTYLDTKDQLSAQISSGREKYQKQLDQGRGFLSYEKCPAGHTKPAVKKCLGTTVHHNSQCLGTEVTVRKCPAGSEPPTGGEVCLFGVAKVETKECIGATQPAYDECVGAQGDTITPETCNVAKEVVTPGSVINDQLTKVLGTTFSQLEAADELNEIIGALFEQLVGKVVGGIGNGLRGTSDTGSGTGSGTRRFTDDLLNESRAPINVPPIITPHLANPIRAVIGADVDLGASAYDVLDGDISENIETESNVDLNTAGTYFIKYNVTNSKGVSALEARRTVNVVEPAEPSQSAGTPPTSGVCGTATSTPVSSVPTTNLCSYGIASVVTGSGPWNWTCNGINNGTDASCSAPKVTALQPTEPTLTASSVSGTAPLNNISLTATNPDTGQFYYYFYCDRARGDTLPPVPPGWINAQVLTPQNTYISPVKCSYSAAGTYKPKVVSLKTLDASGAYVGGNVGAWREAWATVIVN